MYVVVAHGGVVVVRCFRGHMHCGDDCYCHHFASHWNHALPDKLFTPRTDYNWVGRGSQSGQDVWVAQHFNYKRNGIFIDIGANEGAMGR